MYGIEYIKLKTYNLQDLANNAYEKSEVISQN